MIQTIRHIQTKDGTDITARLVLKGSRLGHYSFNPLHTHKGNEPRLEFFDASTNRTALGTYITEYAVKSITGMKYTDLVLVQKGHALDREVVVELLLWARQQARQIH